MPNYRKVIYSGDVVEIEEYFSPRRAGENIHRGANKNMTSEQQAEWNLQRARKKLARLINANFKEGDLFITLTHRNAVSADDGKRELAKFFRRVREYRKRHSLPELKYIGVSETGKRGREHHHIVMSEHDVSHISKLWKLGRVITSRLEPGGDYTGLANYITKETDGGRRKRWCSSRNLDKPTVIVKEIKKVTKSFEPPKGYVVVHQNVYYSEITGSMRYLRAVRIGGYDYARGSG